MLWLRTHDRRPPAELREEIARSKTISAALLSATLDLMAAHCALPDRAGWMQRIRSLIDAQAWTDAALAIVDLDRSRAVRQLNHDDGEWSCRIGSRWTIPDWLDDSVHFTDPSLPLAILGALFESLARREEAATPTTSVPSSGSRAGHSISAVACDNYA